MEAVALIIAMIYHLTNLIDALTSSDSKSTINYTEIKLFLGMGEKKIQNTAMLSLKMFTLGGVLRLFSIRGKIVSAAHE